MIYRTLPEKWDAVVEEIKELHDKGQPVLVGTVSVENSELIADKLKKSASRTTFSTRNITNVKPRSSPRPDAKAP